MVAGLRDDASFAGLGLDEDDVFRLFFAESPIGKSLTLPDGRMARINEAFAHMLGYEPRELEGRVFSDVTHPDDVAASMQCVEALLTGACRIYRFEKRYIRKDGDTVWALVQTRVHRDDQGRPLCFLTHIVDITAQKELEAARRREEAELEAILASIADGILAVGRDGRVIRCNRQFQKLWRIPDELIELGDDNALLSYVLDQLEEPQAFLEKVRDLYDSSETSMDTIVFRDGRVLERYSAPMLREGANVGRVWSFRDLTKRRQVETQLAARDREIEALVRALSHDMRSPLVTITGFVRLIEEDAASPEASELLKDLGLIRDSANRMLRLLDDLIDYWRLGRSDEPVSASPLDELVREALETLGSIVADRGVSVEVVGGPVMVWGRRRELVRVLQNLIENAAKYMGDQERPRVEIGWRMIEAPHGVSRTSELGIYVRDNGMGFAPDARERLFLPFERTHPSLPGAGLGLAGVRRIVEAQGGRVWAESDGPGKGACFWFSLPERR